jgi:hypothetical protein
VMFWQVHSVSPNGVTDYLLSFSYLYFTTIQSNHFLGPKMVIFLAYFEYVYFGDRPPTVMMRDYAEPVNGVRCIIAMLTSGESGS